MRDTSNKCRTTLTEFGQLNSGHVGCNNKNESKLMKRMSARLLFRERLKRISHKRGQPSRPTSRDDPGLIDLDSKIECGNPAHKILFLRLLDLTPKCTLTPPPCQSQRPQLEDINFHPVVKLERLSANSISTKKYSTISLPLEITQVKVNCFEDEDLDDLDLELVFCPLDIPQIYEEITKKQFPNPLSTFSTNCQMNFNCNSFEQTTSQSTKYKSSISHSNYSQIVNQNSLKSKV